MIGHMIYVDDTPTNKVNLNDIALCKLLDDLGYKKQDSESVLAIDLLKIFPIGFPRDFLSINRMHKSTTGNGG